MLILSKPKAFLKYMFSWRTQRIGATGSRIMRKKAEVAAFFVSPLTLTTVTAMIWSNGRLRGKGMFHTALWERGKVRGGRRAPHLGKMPSQGRARRWLRMEDEVGAKCHRSVKAIICSCSLLQESREGITVRDWNNSQQQTRTWRSWMWFWMAEIFYKAAVSLPTGNISAHDCLLKAPQYCRIWSSSDSNSLIRWLVAGCSFSAETSATVSTATGTLLAGDWQPIMCN